MEQYANDRGPGRSQLKHF